HNGKIVSDVPPHRSLLERVRALAGRRLASQVHELEHREGGILVTTYVLPPEEAHPTPRSLELFVGRRYIRDRGLMHAVVMGYEGLVPPGRYPTAVVMVELPEGTVDVNVHPQKLEVRFARPQEIFAAVRRAVTNALKRAPWLARIGAGGAAPVPVYAIASNAPPHRPPPARGLVGEYDHLERSLLGWKASEGEGTAGLLFGPRDSASAVARSRPESDSGGGGAAAAAAAAAAGAREGRGGGDQVGVGVGVGVDAGAGAGIHSATTTEGEVPAERAPTRQVQVQARAQDQDQDQDQEPASSAFFAGLRYLGQLQRTYLVCEGAGELVLIDQHAAHERINFQRLKEAQVGNRPRVQRLLFPQIFDLEPIEAAAAEESVATLTSFGFELRPFGGRSFALEAVPADLPISEAITTVKEVLDDLANLAMSRAVEERLEAMMATIACHSAVRAGDTLSIDEARALLLALDRVDFRAHCPHGRPVLMRIGLAEIARRFGRG
ncbi:MAG: DNA mismatch repair endonuclease MutL, partial [Pseudomonadota bacterium]